MRTRRSLIAVVAAVAGGWRVAGRGPGGLAAPDDACAEPDDGLMRDGCARPPRMVLRVPDGGAQSAALGSSCWATAGNACCVDAIGPVYPTCPLVVPTGAVVAVDLADLGEVSDLRITVRPDADAAGGRPLRSRRRGNRRGDDAVWRLEFARPANPLRLAADLAPGAYAIDLFAYADGPGGGGDTAQGFRIVVEPGADAAGTPVAATPAAEMATPVAVE